MRKVALFGGTFDPPHLGHILTITALLNSGFVDEVWVVPVGDDRADKVPCVSSRHRRAMVDLVLRDCFAGEVVRLEPIQLDGKLPGSFTVDLLRELRRQVPDAEFSFVIGADNALKIKDWKEGAWLWEYAQFVVMPRLGEPEPRGLPENFRVLPLNSCVHTDASSSCVREVLSTGGRLNGVLPLSLRAYICDNALY